MYKEQPNLGIIQTDQEAKNLALQIVSDIALYNPVKVKEGIAKDELFNYLTEELEEGRTYYEKHVVPDLVKRTNYFNYAITDILVKPNAAIASKIW